MPTPCPMVGVPNRLATAQCIYTPRGQRPRRIFLIRRGLRKDGICPAQSSMLRRSGGKNKYNELEAALELAKDHMDEHHSDLTIAERNSRAKAAVHQWSPKHDEHVQVYPDAAPLVKVKVEIGDTPKDSPLVKSKHVKTTDVVESPKVEHRSRSRFRLTRRKVRLTEFNSQTKVCVPVFTVKVG